MANTAGEKELKTDWPHESGIEANKKHHDRKLFLEPEGIDGVKSTVRSEENKGLRG